MSEVRSCNGPTIPDVLVLQAHQRQGKGEDGIGGAVSLSQHEIGAVKVWLREMGLPEPWPLQDRGFRKAVDLFLESVGRDETALHHFFRNFGPDAQAECLRRVNMIRIVQLSRKYSAVKEFLFRRENPSRRGS